MRRAALLAVSCALLAGLAPAASSALPFSGGIARAQTSAVAVAGVRSPAFAADGRLAVSIAGSLWVLRADGRGGWSQGVQLTDGPAWDRDPAWTPDGRSIVFSSDRAGSIDLWRVDLENSAQPVRLTTSSDHDVEPDVAPDGAIVFARGSGGDADLWVLAPDGAERRLTAEAGAEREPAWSPAGDRIAYTAVRAGRRELRVYRLDDGSDTVLSADRQARRPRWSPDGARIAFGAGGTEPGVWVVGADGRYPQAVGTRAGAPAWTPDGAWLVIAEIDGGDGGYNGDPDRLGERLAGDIFGLTGGLHRLQPPAPPTAGDALPLVVADAPLPGTAAGNAAAYDRVWTRVARLYYGLTGETGLERAVAGESAVLQAWRRAGQAHRARALAAGTEADLRQAIWELLEARPVSRGAVGRAGVSSAHALADAAGVEILEAGGNVVDAAVAVSFALGVVEPDASGIGGYGEMLIQLGGMAEPAAIEFSTMLPAAATLGNPAVDTLPRSGPGAAIVPGTVAGMAHAWRQHGSLPWARLLEPAIRLAEDGFPISDGFATTLRRERASFERYPGSVTLFFRDGQPLAAGDTLRNPDLAWVLREIARDGADAFYRGEVARRMVADLAAGGNVMTLADLDRYRAVERRAVRTTYRGNDVYSGPPPITGGVQLVGKLNLLELAPPGASMTSDAATLHAMIEAWKLQPPTGGRIADPDIWPVDVSPFESKDTARARWRCFDAERASVAGALNQPDCGRTPVSPDTTSPEECLLHDRDCRGSGTTGFVVADAAGNIVSVTQTLGTWGGTFHVSPGLGFLYNDKLRSYGGTPGAVNARTPFARTTTVIAPTIVFRGSGADRRPWFGVSAAGNAWITAAVYQMVVGMADHGLGAQQALELPRILGGGRVMQIEDGFSPAMLRQLEAMGHAFQPISLMGELRMGYGAAVLIRDDGTVEAGGDPRRSGAGAAVTPGTSGGGVGG
jgi:gamma-glutamyltranspeptidase